MYKKKKLLILILSMMGAGFFPLPSISQVVEDATDVSTVVVNDSNVYTITGGMSRGNALFHSFEAFSLSADEEAFFDHSAAISTIFSRVTGGEESSIDGLIRTNTDVSTADLFLVNPNGIVFGSNASLDIGGSFIATTAEAITFSDNTRFSATSSEPVSLVVSQPIGLWVGENSGGIINRAFLQVPDGRTLAAVGNGINFLEGGLYSVSGHLEVASVVPDSMIMLASPENSIWRLNFADGAPVDFSDIRLSSFSFLDTTSDEDEQVRSSGDIQIRGRRVSLLGESEILADNYGLGKGGDILISASESLTIDEGTIIAGSAWGEGAGSDITIDVSDGEVEIAGNSSLITQSYPNATEAAGNFTLFAANLSIEDGSIISTSTLSESNGGNILLDVSEGWVELTGSRLLAQSTSNATGAAGAITLNARELTVQEGSRISTSALGNGTGGKLSINAINGLVEILGVPEDNSSASLLSSITLGEENAGEIHITTGRLLVQDGGEIQSGTFGIGNGSGTFVNASEAVVVTGEGSQISSSNNASSSGNAGPIDIMTERLLVQDGASIFTSTNGSGQGGNLTVLADDVTVRGEQSGLFARTENSGASGFLNLTADTLSIQSGASITVSTDGNASPENLGEVKNVDIIAENITLDDGEITAESLSGNGGNLNIRVQDFILLFNNSLISATAGTANSIGNGGNVDINIPNGFIITTPDENNDIIARAFSNTGGNINITAQSLIGFDTRQSDISDVTNDINASSELGENGTVTLNNLELDPTQGLIELPTNLSTPNQVAQRCFADSGSQNAFVVTGQGGTTPSPRNIVRNETAGLVDLGSDVAITRALSNVSSTTSQTLTTDEQPLLVEAQAWQRSPTGTVTLIAQSPPQTTNSTAYPSCSRQAQSQVRR